MKSPAEFLPGFLFSLAINDLGMIFSENQLPFFGIMP
jgi:hypothetical protein